MTKYAILNVLLTKRAQTVDEQHPVRNALVPAFIAPLAAAPASIPIAMVNRAQQTERDQRIARILERLIRRKAGVQVISGPGDEFNAAYKAILSSTRNPSILAHEVGHVLQPSARYWPLVGALRNVSGIATVLPAFTGSRDQATQLAVLGSLLQLPILGQELSASMRGTQLLRRLGGSPVRAFAGIPSYAAMAGLPWVAKAIRERMGGYR